MTDHTFAEVIVTPDGRIAMQIEGAGTLWMDWRDAVDMAAVLRASAAAAACVLQVPVSEYETELTVKREAAALHIADEWSRIHDQ